MSEGPSRVTFWTRIAFSSGLDLVIAASFLVTWIWPYAIDERAVHKMTFVMLVEFLVVHSTGFFTALSSRSALTPWWKNRADAERAERLRRALSLAGLLGLYLLFAAGFSASYGGPWPIVAFLAVSLPKFPALIFDPKDDDATFRGMATWAAMTALYLGGIFLTLVLDVPPLGVTPEVIAAQEFGIGGIWPEEPYRVLAFGAVYFTGMAGLSGVNEFLRLSRERRG